MSNNRDQHLCSKQQRTGVRGQKKQREQALEKTQQINLIAVSHFRGLGLPVMALEWDTVYIYEAAEGTALS